MAAQQNFIEKDRALTQANRVKLAKNRNLLWWYENLYRRLLGSPRDAANQKILEIGSGTSPLKLFFPHVLTSDILDLDYLDYRFDCLEIDQFNHIPGESIDIITVTNVLHHLKNPLVFLFKATKKLKTGGKIIIVEPYFSAVSTLIYKFIHPESTDFSIEEPTLSESKGPVTSANIALPYLIFFSKKGWRERLNPYYNFSLIAVSHYSSLAYMVTGGISHNFPVPLFLYRMILAIDLFFVDHFPKLFSSFFVLELHKK